MKYACPLTLTVAFAALTGCHAPQQPQSASVPESFTRFAWDGFECVAYRAWTRTDPFETASECAKKYASCPPTPKMTNISYNPLKFQLDGGAYQSLPATFYGEFEIALMESALPSASNAGPLRLSFLVRNALTDDQIETLGCYGAPVTSQYSYSEGFIVPTAVPRKALAAFTTLPFLDHVEITHDPELID